MNTDVWELDGKLSIYPYTVSVCAGKPELRTEVDIIVADVEEPDSLAAMCKQAVIVLNCVGPVSWRFHRNVCVLFLPHRTCSFFWHKLVFPYVVSQLWHQCSSTYHHRPLYFSSLSHTHTHTWLHVHNEGHWLIVHNKSHCLKSQNGEEFSTTTASRPVHHSGSCFNPNSFTTVDTTIAHSSIMPAWLKMRHRVEAIRRQSHFVFQFQFLCVDNMNTLISV